MLPQSNLVYEVSLPLTFVLTLPITKMCDQLTQLERICQKILISSPYLNEHPTHN